MWSNGLRKAGGRMTHLIGDGTDLAWVAVKALLLYITAVVGFRLGERRTLAEMSPFDFVAAVAVGAIVGRVPNSTETSYLAGAITLVSVLMAHRIIMRMRHFPSVAHLVEHSPRILVDNGRLIESELRRCGIMHRDLYAQLRQQGIGDLSEVRYMVFEAGGQMSIIRPGEVDGPQPELIRDVSG